MWHSINEKIHKIKFFRKDFLLLLLIILSVCAAFFLGVLSVTKDKTFKLRQYDTTLIPEKHISFVLASRHGKTYYYLWCPGAKRIKRANRVYFDSAKDAESKGYRLSQSCAFKTVN